MDTVGGAEYCEVWGGGGVAKWVPISERPNKPFNQVPEGFVIPAASPATDGHREWGKGDAVLARTPQGFWTPGVVMRKNKGQSKRRRKYRVR